MGHGSPAEINVLTKMEKNVAENVLILYLLGHGVVVSISKLSSRKIG